MSEELVEEVKKLLVKITDNPNDRESAERLSDIILPDMQVLVTTRGLEDISFKLLEQGVHPESYLVALATVLMKLYQERYSDSLTDDKIAYWVQNIGEFSSKMLTFATEKIDFIIDVMPEEQFLDDIPSDFFAEAKQWHKAINRAIKAGENQDVETKVKLTTIVIQALDEFMAALSALDTPVEIEVFTKCCMSLWLKAMVLGFADKPDIGYYFSRYWNQLYPFMINDFMQSLWKD